MTDRELKKRGKNAEQQVSKVLRHLGSEYKVFDDVMFKLPNYNKKSKDNIRTTQIDHIVVSPYGVFVIETKSHGGTIFGSSNYFDQYWTQVYYKYGKKRMYSPIHQNFTHLQIFEQLSGCPNSCVLGVVVFTNPSVNLDNIKDCNTVVHISQLAAFMNLPYLKTIRFTPQQVQQYVSFIKKNNISNAYYNRVHVNAIRRNYW